MGALFFLRMDFRGLPQVLSEFAGRQRLKLNKLCKMDREGFQGVGRQGRTIRCVRTINTGFDQQVISFVDLVITFSGEKSSRGMWVGF